MKLRSILDLPCGMRAVFSNLQLCSSLSSHLLLEREMYVSSGKIASHYNLISNLLTDLSYNRASLLTEKVRGLLFGLRDIRNTLSAVSAGRVPDDIELFEIKSLAMITQSIRPLLKEISKSLPELPDLENVVKLLDPDDIRIPSFYIYDSYSSELASIRKRIKSLNEFNEDLYAESSIIEDKIREQLAKEIRIHIENLSLSLHHLADTDILLAKAALFVRWNLTIPELSDDRIYYEGMFNPEVSEILERQGLSYQPVSVTIDSKNPAVLMGANMGGKSVTLRTLALSQFMFQFGFGVPAKRATIVPVHEIFHLSGDYQDVNKGLSSFAAEMRMADKLLKHSTQSSSILALLDEPARTTNPYEGKALVESLITILKERQILTIVATHYNVDAPGCVKMRVRGFEDGRMNYELIIAKDGQVPREAINIAKSLGIDDIWLEKASELLNRK